MFHAVSRLIEHVPTGLNKHFSVYIREREKALYLHPSESVGDGGEMQLFLSASTSPRELATG